MNKTILDYRDGATALRGADRRSWAAMLGLLQDAFAVTLH